MTDKQWRRALVDLKQERDNLNPNDTVARQTVDQLMKDVEQYLASDEVLKAQSNKAIGKRLQSAVEQFEATHPTLTYTLNQFMTSLSGSGI
jgi:3-methyladenine DNA glycosylase AlkC